MPNLPFAALLATVLAAVVATSACTVGGERSDPPVSSAISTRPAQTDACTLSPSPKQVAGLPAVSAVTVRLAPRVVGEKRTFQSRGRQLTAWVGVDALSSFSDLDLVPVDTGRSARLEGWTTAVVPDLFVVRARTGHAPPCDLLYVSANGLPLRTILEVVGGLRVTVAPVGAAAGTQ